MKKHFTIVIEAADESAARALVPGATIGPNRIVGCSLGDALTVNEELLKLIPDDQEEAVARITREDLAAFLPT